MNNATTGLGNIVNCKDKGMESFTTFAFHPADRTSGHADIVSVKVTDVEYRVFSIRPLLVIESNAKDRFLQSCRTSSQMYHHVFLEIKYQL